MNTKSVGELTEAKIIVKLLELGYVCSKPFGDNARYDLIVDDGLRLSRVQIKTGRVREGSVIFNVTSANRYTNKHYKGQIEAFVVFVPEINKYYWIPIEDTGKSKMQFSLNGNHFNAKSASRFEI